jgi:glycosyltransferase involved in cell wall biosynthesis
MSDCAETPPVPGLVSVVTAAYNMGGYIAETLESVLGQDYPQVESIVVDDGSTDDTASVLEGYADNPRVSVVRQSNAGQTVAKNRGIREARGEFIAFCDADDTWRRDKLSRQLPRFADAAVAVVYSDIECVDGQGQVLPYYDIPHYEGRVTAPLLIDNFVPFPTVVVRAAVLRAAGGFDESLTMSIDYDLWLRISVNHLFAFVPERLANYRVWEGQMSKKTGERLDNFMRLLDRFLGENPRAATRREIDRAYAHVYVTRGYWHAREGRRAEAWRDYQAALRLDPLAVRMWKRIISLGLDRDREPPAARP